MAGEYESHFPAKIGRLTKCQQRSTSLLQSNCSLSKSHSGIEITHVHLFELEGCESAGSSTVAHHQFGG